MTSTGVQLAWQLLRISQLTEGQRFTESSIIKKNKKNYHESPLQLSYLASSPDEPRWVSHFASLEFQCLNIIYYFIFILLNRGAAGPVQSHAVFYIQLHVWWNSNVPSKLCDGSLCCLGYSSSASIILSPLGTNSKVPQLFFSPPFSVEANCLRHL